MFKVGSKWHCNLCTNHKAIVSRHDVVNDLIFLEEEYGTAGEISHSTFSFSSFISDGFVPSEHAVIEDGSWWYHINYDLEPVRIFYSAVMSFKANDSYRIVGANEEINDINSIMATFRPMDKMCVQCRSAKMAYQDADRIKRPGRCWSCIGSVA